jgi:3-oxoacyl-[acyl-carrier-protein] synthase-3
LFGDATSAAVVSTRIPSRAAVVHSMFGSDPSGCDEVTIPRLGYFGQNGGAVQKFAIKKMSALLKEAVERASPSQRERLVYIGHQANLTMLESVCRRAGLPPERHFHNIVEFGNQCAAGAPTVLSQSWERFVAGDVAAVDRRRIRAFVVEPDRRVQLKARTHARRRPHACSEGAASRLAPWRTARAAL